MSSKGLSCLLKDCPVFPSGIVLSYPQRLSCVLLRDCPVFPSRIVLSSPQGLSCLPLRHCPVPLKDCAVFPSGIVLSSPKGLSDLLKDCPVFPLTLLPLIAVFAVCGYSLPGCGSRKFSLPWVTMGIPARSRE